MSAELYDTIGLRYDTHRRPDPRIAAAIQRALGGADSVVNVGAGAGSYEPTDRRVVAVEPSLEMIRQRRSAAPVVQAAATDLPFHDGAFAAALAVLTVHHWPDRARGLAELARVAPGRVVILTWDPETSGFWLTQDYFPSIPAIDRPNFPTMDEFRRRLGEIEVVPLLVPHDCTDGFLGAYWRRPHAYLDDGVRMAISTFSKIGDAGPGLARLRRDLEDGAWERRHGDLLGRAEIDLGYRLLVAPYIAWGQTPGNVPRIGIIHLSGHHQVVVDGLRQGLRDRGLEEGKHIVFDIRQIPGDLKLVEEAARDLERSRVTLIYTVNTAVTVAAKRVTTRTPMVFYVGGDPVADGLVESLAKPGGRLTGVLGLSRELTAKRLQVLKEMIPTLARVVTFYNPGDPTARGNAHLGREAARQFSVQLVERPVNSVEELRLGLQALKPREVHAYLHTPSALVTSQAPVIIEAMRAKRLPAMFHEQDLVAKGALAAYGVSYFDIGRVSAKHVQRILAGTHPKDLPLENYDKVGLALNLRVARELGITMPPALLRRADTVIE